MIFNRNEKSELIDMAIEYCEQLYDKYDDGEKITDMDIAYIIEILKGRE